VRFDLVVQELLHAIEQQRLDLAGLARIFKQRAA
jgi:hypothetical protein